MAGRQGGETGDEARRCGELADQLAALKRIAFSTQDLADPESLALVLSKQMRKSLGAKRNEVWLENGRGSMIRMAADGRLAQGSMREVCGPDELEERVRSSMEGAFLAPLSSASGRLGLLAAKLEKGDHKELLGVMAEFAARNLEAVRTNQGLARENKALSAQAEKLQAANRRLSALNRLGVSAMGAQTPETLCASVLTFLAREYATKGAAVLLSTGRGGGVRCPAANGSLKSLEGSAMNVGHSPALSQAKKLSQAAGHLDPDAPAEVEVGGLAVPHWGLVPLRGRERNLGLLLFQNPGPMETDPLEALAGFCAVALDNLLMLDERKKINRLLARKTNELAEAMAVAKNAARAKSEFLANMSHEIRTPINAIVGVTDLLGETCDDPGQEHYLGILKSAGDSLLALINDILDLSKIEAGKQTVDLSAFNLREVAEKTGRVLAFNAHKKGLEFICAISPRTPEVVESDSTKIRQILVNLLGNAVKFTPQGQVRLSLDAEPDGQGGAMLFLEVRDTGIGIPADKLESVFSSFTQAQASTTREYGGTGLGLTICRRMARMLGGDVTAESALGKGSAFKAAIPVKIPAEQPAEPEGAREELQGACVLVVDDNQDARDHIRTLLTHWGADCATAGNKAQAMDAARRSGAECKIPDLALVDADLGEEKGLETAQALMEKGLAKRCLMMVDTTVNPCEFLKGRSTPVSGCLTKPVTAGELLLAAASTLRKKTDEQERKAMDHSPSEEAWESARVLLVEDSANNRMLFEAYMKKLPVSPMMAENGREAVEAFAQEAFDLVIMDIQMPLMDGYEATAAIREMEAERGLDPTPIIALTAHATTQDRDRCLAAGATSFLPKPVRKNELIQAMRELLFPRD